MNPHLYLNNLPSVPLRVSSKQISIDVLTFFSQFRTDSYFLTFLVIVLSRIAESSSSGDQAKGFLVQDPVQFPGTSIRTGVFVCVMLSGF